MNFGYQIGLQLPTQKKKEEEYQSKMFPGLDDEQSKRLIETVDKMGVTNFSDKLQKQQEIYREVLPAVKAKENQIKKTIVKNETFNELQDIQDPQQKATKIMALKMEDLADIIKTKYNLDPKAPTEGIIQSYNQMLNDQKIDPKLVEDYMNGKSEELLYVSGLKDRPVDDRSGLEKGFTDVVGGAYDSVTGLPRFVAENLAKGVGWIAEKLGADEEKVQGLVDSYIASLDDFSGKAIGADTESGLYKGTKIVGDIAQIANPAGLGKAGLKAGQIASKVAKEGKLIGKIAKGATEGVVDTAIFMPQSEQRLATKEELLGGAVIGGALPVGSKMLGKAKEKVGELGAKIYAKTIKLNPSQIKKIMKPSIAGVEPERWLLDRKIGGSLDQIQSQLDDISTKSYNELNTKAGKVVGEFESESGKSILSALKKKVDGIEGLEDINTKLDDLLAKDKYSLPEMFDIKRTLDKRITMYSKSGDPIAQETAEGLRNLRDRLRKDIDTIAESNGLTDLRQLSKDIQVSTEISNALENTIARESKNRAMSLTDLLVGGTVAGGVYAGTSDPRKTIQTVAGLLISKKILENPNVRTKIAIQLDKLAPKVQTEIKEAMINNTPLKSNLRNMLKKALTLAGVKVLPSNEE